MENAGVPEPSAQMRPLDRLVGKWKISGGTQGECSYEWMDGGHFLIQRGTVTMPGGGETTWMQVIGFERGMDGQSGELPVGRLFTTAGDTLTYVSESNGDDITIWFGEKGSPAYYKGRFSEDGNTLAGEWIMPGDGGYEETMERMS